MPESPAADASRSRRALRRRRARRLLLAGTVALAIGGRTADAGAATAPPFAIELDRSTAVFQLTDLRPGPIGSRCLLVSIHNGLADEAILSATVGGNGLADYLDLRIEAGTSADPATCTDFAGVTVFDDTVGALGTQHPDPANGVPLPLVAQTSAVVRFTLALRSDNAAMGRTATLTFRFDAQDVTGAPPPTTTTLPPTTAPPTTVAPTVPPVPTVPTSPTVTTPNGSTTAPSAASTTTTAASTTTTVTPSTTVAPTTVARPGTTARNGTGGSGGTAGGPATTSAGGGPAEVVVTDPTVPEPTTDVITKAVEVVTQTAATAARTTTVPATFLSFVALFLVVQDRFDRNDPKLARAPLAPEPEMVFQPRRGGRRL